MARGLSRAGAERIIVWGVFQDILLDLEPVRETLGEGLEARIPQAQRWASASTRPVEIASARRGQAERFSWLHLSPRGPSGRSLGTYSWSVVIRGSSLHDGFVVDGVHSPTPTT